jgi:hypothetical protein
VNTENTAQRRRYWLGILALACSAALVGALAFVASVQADETFSTNEAGNSLGSVPEALESGQHVDLVLVIGDSGREGYAYRLELDGEPFAPDAGREEIVRALSARSVPVYLSDGATQIDSFTVDEPQGFFIGPDGDRTEFNGAEEYADLYLAK